MVRKLQRDELEAELKAVEHMISQVPSEDPVGKIAFQSRREELEREISQLDTQLDTAAEVALIFDGGPVYGSRAIDAEFAGKALNSYQELIAKIFASTAGGGLSQRGPVPQKDASRLLVTDLVRGSFGFTLQEARADEHSFAPTALRDAVARVSKILGAVGAQTDEHFSEILEDLDQRVFSAVKEFVENVHDNIATFRLIDGDNEQRFDSNAVLRAHNRVTQTNIDEVEYSTPIELIGVIPVGRRFEAIAIGTTQYLSGKIGPAFSENYLQRVHQGAEPLIGQNWLGHFRKKTVRRSDGRIKESLLLLRLNPLEEA